MSWRVDAADVFHFILHKGLVAVSPLASLDPLTSAVMTVAGIEGVDVWHKRRVGPGEVRDFLFRGVGAAAGLLIVGELEDLVVFASVLGAVLLGLVLFLAILEPLLGLFLEGSGPEDAE